jgi:hypothetical protein
MKSDLNGALVALPKRQQQAPVGRADMVNFFIKNLSIRLAGFLSRR